MAKPPRILDCTKRTPQIFHLLFWMAYSCRYMLVEELSLKKCLGEFRFFRNIAGDQTVSNLSKPFELVCFTDDAFWLQLCSGWRFRAGLLFFFFLRRKDNPLLLSLTTRLAASENWASERPLKQTSDVDPRVTLLKGPKVYPNDITLSTQLVRLRGLSAAGGGIWVTGREKGNWLKDPTFQAGIM